MNISYTKDFPCDIFQDMVMMFCKFKLSPAFIAESDMN